MNESQPFENELNEHQHGALSSRLSSIERELYKAERLLNGDLAKGELFETISDITQAEAEESRAAKYIQPQRFDWPKGFNLMRIAFMTLLWLRINGKDESYGA